MDDDERQLLWDNVERAESTVRELLVDMADPDELLAPIRTAVETGAPIYFLVHPSDYWVQLRDMLALQAVGDAPVNAEVRAHDDIEPGYMMLTFAGSEHLDASYIPDPPLHLLR